MPSFKKTPGLRDPFGKNEYLRSDRNKLFDSATYSAAATPSEMRDGNSVKFLQSGEVMALITVGPEAGKVGPFQAAGTAEVQTITKTGTWSGGTYDLTVLGTTVEEIPYNATAAAVQALFQAEGVDTVVFSGGPLSTTPLVLTYYGNMGNVSIAVVDHTDVTGSTPGHGVVETTAGTAGATDGRGNTANIVGLAETFLPWELNHRDHEGSILYGGVARQAWCFERDATGARIPLSNTTRDAMLALPRLRPLSFA